MGTEYYQIFLKDDDSLDLDKLAQNIHELNADKGFWGDFFDAINRGDVVAQRTFMSEKIALCHSELSELLEARRKPAKKDEHCPEFTNAEIELADVFIRLFDMAPVITQRLQQAILAKLEYNQTRPYKHGKNS